MPKHNCKKYSKKEKKMKHITNGTIASTKCARLHLKNAWEKKTEETKTITHETLHAC